MATMKSDIKDCVAAYKQQLAASDIRIAYEFLIKYVMELKAAFEKMYSAKYSSGNVSPGYMDFTYFPFSDTYLREKKLRFGIVLNHKAMSFELWLLGRNAEVQKRYWNRLKTAKWNKNQPTMPKYSVLEATLIDNPDFSDTDALTIEIIDAADSLASEIIQYIKGNP